MYETEERGASRCIDFFKAEDGIRDLTVTGVQTCALPIWNASAIIGAPQPEKLVVEIDIDLNRDGSLAGAPRVVNALEINLSGNRFWKVAEQNAIRAVQACAPYDFFDPSRYQEI